MNAPIYEPFTVHYLRAILKYNAHTGAFFWKARKNAPARVRNALINHNEAGGIATNGYRYICINGRKYLASRLAFFYTMGFWPIEVDHKNGNPSDNRWQNLREAERSPNMANMKKRKDSTSGYKGVSFSKQKKKWRAHITQNKKYKHLGYFQTSIDAHAAYIRAAKQLYGAFARSH